MCCSPTQRTTPRVKLADFGIARLADSARLTTAGMIVVSAQYLSPEQARGEDVGPPSDVYALGLVLLECVTGAPVFPGAAIEPVVARLHRNPQVRTILTLPSVSCSPP
jgi:eukaryotic-like serine/threonine-protein kinase